MTWRSFAEEPPGPGRTCLTQLLTSLRHSIVLRRPCRYTRPRKASEHAFANGGDLGRNGRRGGDRRRRSRDLHNPPELPLARSRSCRGVRGRAYAGRRIEGCGYWAAARAQRSCLYGARKTCVRRGQCRADRRGRHCRKRSAERQGRAPRRGKDGRRSDCRQRGSVRHHSPAPQARRPQPDPGDRAIGGGDIQHCACRRSGAASEGRRRRVDAVKSPRRSLHRRCPRDAR